MLKNTRWCLGGRGWATLRLGLTWKWGLETHLASWRKSGSITLLNSEGSMTSRISSSSFRNITSLGLWVLGQNLRSPTITCEMRRTRGSNCPSTFAWFSRKPSYPPHHPTPRWAQPAWPPRTAQVSLAWICFLGVHRFSFFKEEAMSPVGPHPPPSTRLQHSSTGTDGQVLLTEMDPGA